MAQSQPNKAPVQSPYGNILGGNPTAKPNTGIASGLSIGSGGGALLGGQPIQSQQQRNTSALLSTIPGYKAPLINNPGTASNVGATTQTGNAPVGSTVVATGNLTQAQLDAQNAAQGKTQFNTGATNAAGSSGQTDTAGNVIPQSQTFPGLLSLGVNTAQGALPIGQKAQYIASSYGQQIADVGQRAAAAKAGYLTTGTTPVAEGNAAVVANTAAQQEAALAQGETAALQGTAQGLTAQNQAATGTLTGAGYAQPQLGQIGSQQYYNPLNPGATSGTGGSALASLPASAQTAVNSYAEQVRNGQMTRADAESRLSAYGITGTNALNEALGGSFNTNASNASAQTTAQGQQIQTAADSTNKALDTLSTSFQSLPGWQTNTIPVGNSIGQWIGQQFGDAALQQYKTNLADARSQLIGVLNSSGGTPTGNENTALQYLPDNMTPAQFQQNVGTAQQPGIVRQLVSQKVSAFTGSGQQNQSAGTNSSGSSSSGFGWNGQ